MTLVRPDILGPPGVHPLSEGSPVPLAERFTGDDLVVGDRLAPDIEEANRARTASLLVLSGATTGLDLVLAGPARRPTFVAVDRMTGLLRPHPPARRDEVDGWSCGGWVCSVTEAGIALVGRGEGVDALRVLCLAWWEVGGHDPAIAREVLAVVRL